MMTLNTFTSGVNTSFSTELNENTVECLFPHIDNCIRMLKNYSVQFSSDEKGLLAENFVDTDGQLNLVSTTDTTATFETDRYCAEDTTSFYDGTEYSTTSNSYVTVKTFSSINTPVRKLTNRLKSESGSGRTAYCKVIFNYSDASSTEVEQTAVDTATYIDLSYTNPNLTKEVSSIVIQIKHESGFPGEHAYVDENKVFSTTESVVVLNIPSGRFNSTVSSIIGSALVADWESGVSIQCKVTNATEDSGYANYKSVNSFTAFTSEPTKLWIKLTPKTTSPTAGALSIYGAGVIVR